MSDQNQKHVSSHEVPIARIPQTPNNFSHRSTQQKSLDQLGLLTTGEMEVLKQVVAGKPNKTIAKRLLVSIKTVEKRRSSLMKKLGVRSIPGLMRIWFQANPHELGLVDETSSPKALLKPDNAGQ